MDDICWVTATKMRHRDADLLIVLLKVDAHVLFQFLASSHGSIHRVLVDDPAVEQAVLWDLLKRDETKLSKHILSSVSLSSR